MAEQREEEEEEEREAAEESNKRLPLQSWHLFSDHHG
jgi:hypothetical protein